MEALTGCIAGAAPVGEIRAMLTEAGFDGIKVEARRDSGAIIAQCLPGAAEFELQVGRLVVFADRTVGDRLAGMCRRP